MTKSDAQALLSALPPVGVPGAFSGWQAAVDDAYELAEAVHHTTDELNASRPPGRLRWRTLTLDAGRLTHPEATLLQWPSRPVWPVLRPWGVVLSTREYPHAEQAGWSPLNADPRMRLLLPPYIRAHLGIRASDAVITGTPDLFGDDPNPAVYLIAADALEHALGLNS